MLTLLVEPRKTLQTFLEDIRQIRNSITVQQPLSGAQIQLLDCYYTQITRSVQRAFEEGRTRVNPAALMAVDESELHAFWEKAQKWTAPQAAIFLKCATAKKNRLSAPRVRQSSANS